MAPVFYRWPVKDFDKTHPRLGTLGEYRGTGPNDITRLHSGTDIDSHGSDVEVYAPTPGLVRRQHGNPGNPSGGSGPIRVGHFAFNHIYTVEAEPGQARYGVFMPQHLPIHVEAPGFSFHVPKAGVANPAKDADFEARTLEDIPVVAWRRQAADDFANVTIWPITRPIGINVQPTDLHVFYYDTPDGPVAEGGAIRNALEVFENYANDREPVAEGLWMVSQNGNARMLNMKNKGNGAIHTAAMGGVKFKLWAHAPFSAKCGVYQVEYEILNHRGTTTGRLGMWKFHALPPRARSFDIVDEQESKFNSPHDKFTVYIITNSRNGNINAAHHWEVENAGQWPDGCYAIKVWIQSIKASGGVGVDPEVHEVLYAAEWKLRTLAQGRRALSVTNKFMKRASEWQPAFAECQEKRAPEPRRKRATAKQPA